MISVGPMTANSREKRWFDEGCDAFKRSFPKVAVHVPSDRLYVCPICLHAYSREGLAAGILTREHVPPQSIGGRRIVLTEGPLRRGGLRTIQNWSGNPRVRMAERLSRRGAATGMMGGFLGAVITAMGRHCMAFSCLGSHSL
jgi:hypothetical protein